ncbi:hypothetical protein ACFXPA_36310 [Amycolatopsis sp. NPDC059090]|uniref:hypothetical protein n=1 Tax=unclassified Amycolatopsis TaxID=2618356 RepID=UPI00366DAC2D
MGTESGEDGCHVDGLSRSRRDRPEGVVVPQLSLADRFDRWVDECVVISARQKTDEARERYVDLMVGLVDAAAAMRATARRDSIDAVTRLRSAVELLQSVDVAELELSADAGERTRRNFGA